MPYGSFHSRQSSMNTRLNSFKIYTKPEMIIGNEKGMIGWLLSKLLVGYMNLLNPAKKKRGKMSISFRVNFYVSH